MGLFEIAAAALMLAGTGVCVIGIFGVMRMPDLYTRLHAAGVVLTLGASAILVSLLLVAGPQAGLRAVATALFLLLTSPLVTHTLARTAYSQDVSLAADAPRDDLAKDRDFERESR